MAQSLLFCSAAFPQPQNEHEIVSMLTMAIKNIHDEVAKIHQEKKALRTELSLANERLQALENFFFHFNSKDARHKTFQSSSSSFTAAGSPTSLASLASGSSHSSAAGEKSQEYPFNGVTASVAEPGKMSPVLNSSSASLAIQAKSPLRSNRTPYVSLVDAILGPAPPLRSPRPEPGSPLGAASVTITAATVVTTTGNTGNSETARKALWIANREIYISQKRGQAFNTVEDVRFWQEKASKDELEQNAALKKSQRDAKKVIEGDKKGKNDKICGERWKGKARESDWL